MDAKEQAEDILKRLSITMSYEEATSEYTIAKEYLDICHATAYGTIMCCIALRDGIDIKELTKDGAFSDPPNEVVGAIVKLSKKIGVKFGDDDILAMVVRGAIEREIDKAHNMVTGMNVESFAELVDVFRVMLVTQSEQSEDMCGKAASSIEQNVRTIPAIYLAINQADSDASLRTYVDGVQEIADDIVVIFEKLNSGGDSDFNDKIAQLNVEARAHLVERFGDTVDMFKSVKYADVAMVRNRPVTLYNYAEYMGFAVFNIVFMFHLGLLDYKQYGFVIKKAIDMRREVTLRTDRVAIRGGGARKVSPAPKATEHNEHKPKSGVDTPNISSIFFDN